MVFVNELSSKIVLVKKWNNIYLNLFVGVIERKYVEFIQTDFAGFKNLKQKSLVVFYSSIQTFIQCRKVSKPFHFQVILKAKSQK